MRGKLAVLLVAVLAAASMRSAAAEDYPTRPVTMIVPFPAGGATDTLARFLGERLNAVLRQPVVIENVGGAAGSLGVGRAVRASPDGYTLSIGTSTTHRRALCAAVRSVARSRADHPDRQRAAPDRRPQGSARG
jgi:tripartite-type tricarboxylate transporter receptor subunit TctC